VAHHLSQGGVSRYVKFAYFLSEIVPAYSTQINGPGLDALLDAYTQAVRQGLLDCTIAPGLASLRAVTRGARWLIVSGGDQAELRAVFSARGLDQLFDGGIFGSPDDKDTILSRELATGNITYPALFLGDSRYDHEAAARAGIDFLFVSEWSEFSNWEDYVRQHHLRHIRQLSDIVTS